MLKNIDLIFSIEETSEIGGNGDGSESRIGDFHNRSDDHPGGFNTGIHQVLQGKKAEGRRGRRDTQTHPRD